MPLTPDELRWLVNDGALTFSLTRGQVRMLELAFERDTFFCQDIASAIGFTREAVQRSLHSLEKRGLVRLRRVRPSLTRSPHSAEVGPALRAMFHSLIPRERMA